MRIIKLKSVYEKNVGGGYWRVVTAVHNRLLKTIIWV